MTSFVHKIYTLKFSYHCVYFIVSVILTYIVQEIFARHVFLRIDEKLRRIRIFHIHFTLFVYRKAQVVKSFCKKLS